jgi:tetratricopeptide (TPR) repeat protein
MPFLEVFERGRACHRAGDLRQAAELYRRVVQAEPQHADAWQLLASALQGLGELPAAADAYARALRLRPDAADLHVGLGLSLGGQGRRGEALECFRQALRVQPGHAEALLHLGVALAEAGRLEEAVAHLRQAVGSRPELAAGHHNLGVALAQQGQREEAVRCLEEALRRKPDYAEGHYNLGGVLRDLGKKEEACGHYREAIALRPGYAGAYNNLGLTLTELGRHAEALVLLGQAVRLEPEGKEGHNNLGLAHAGLGDFDKAQGCYEEALRLDPGYAEAHANLGSAFKERGRPEEALACYQVALWHQPGLASAHYNRALAWLQKGDYAKGWPEYEWRWKRPGTPVRPFRQPRWDGSPLGGRTILLWCEQGLGDAIQFVRYAKMVKARGGRVVLECPPGLERLFTSCPGVDRVVAEGQALPDFDVQVPLMSLPAVFGTTLEAVPAEVPYLAAEPARVEAWKERLAGVKGFRVGVVWQGNPRFAWDSFRSFPLAALEPLAKVEDVRLVSLQKGPGAEEVRSRRGRFEVLEFGEDLDGDGAFLDTAALMRNLDLVVSADTAAAHLAGALGVPGWVAVSAVADWRWLVGREDTPWYPSMRLFRQQRTGGWDEVFGHMARELSAVRLDGAELGDRQAGGREACQAVAPQLARGGAGASGAAGGRRSNDDF